MTPAVLGLDVSPLRLGWGLVALDDGRAIACGMERIDLPNKGWSHEQVADALAVVDALCGHRRCEVSVIGIEQPWLRFAKGSYDAGRAVQEAHNACERRWPHADGPHYLQPKEWRTLAGLPGGAKKAEVAEYAANFLPTEALDACEACHLEQDAADALLIALATQRRNAATHDAAMTRESQGRAVLRWEDSAA